MRFLAILIAIPTAMAPYAAVGFGLYLFGAFTALEVMAGLGLLATVATLFLFSVEMEFYLKDRKERKSLKRRWKARRMGYPEGWEKMKV